MKSHSSPTFWHSRHCGSWVSHLFLRPRQRLHAGRCDRINSGLAEENSECSGASMCDSSCGKGRIAIKLPLYGFARAMTEQAERANCKQVSVISVRITLGIHESGGSTFFIPESSNFQNFMISILRLHETFIYKCIEWISFYSPWFLYV